jgi:pimeloyl-ACP methyl ester carboxylesterase
MRNHGRSPHSDKFDYVVMMEDIEDFIKKHQLQQPILIGHSMGGKVAMYYALENPEVVHSVIIVDISMRHYPEREAHKNIIAAMQAVDFKKIKSREDVEKQLKSHINNHAIRQFIMKNLTREGQEQFSWRLNIKAISQNLPYIFEGVEHPGMYPGPALFIRGGHSDYILESDFNKIYTHFPEAEIVTIEGTTHWVHAEAPDRLCAEISRFTGKHCDFSV